MALLTAGPAAVLAQDGETASSGQTAISPIFSQLVMFSMPATFTVVGENASDDRYIREAVLKGETVEQWSEMITVTGAKGLAHAEGATPQGFVESIASGFESACPETFSVTPLSVSTISGYDAFAAVASCGAVTSAGSGHGEAALIVAIKGDDDMYTIQWAERTPARAEKVTIDEAAWKQRYEQLNPVRLCAIVEGEAAPFPSCLNTEN